MRLLHIVILLGVTHCASADDLDTIVASDISATQRGELYERLTKVEFAPIAAKLARFLGHFPIITGIGPQTRHPWSEPRLSEGDRIACTLRQLWDHHLPAVRQRGESVGIMLSILDDPIFETGVGSPLPDFPGTAFSERFDGRALALYEIRGELGREKVPTGSSQAMRDRALRRLDRLARDTTQPDAVRTTTIEALSYFADPNAYLDLAIHLASKVRTPAGQGQTFNGLMCGGRRLNAENQKRYLRHVFSLLEASDDGSSGAGYHLAISIGHTLGIRPLRDLQGPFTPDQRLPKYQGKNGGLTPGFFQDTVNNARKWWSENQSRY